MHPRRVPPDELTIVNSRLTSTGEPQTVMVLVRRIPAGTNQSAVVFARQFTIPEDGHVAIEDLPGWPEATDDRFVLVVRVKNGTAASRDIAGVDGNSIAVFVTETGLDIEGDFVVPSTTACTPSRG